MTSSKRKICFYLNIIFIFFLVLFSLSFVRSFVITNIVETLMHRKLRDFSRWDNILQHSMYLFIFYSGIFCFLFFTIHGQEFFSKIKERFLEVFNNKNAKKSLIILLGIFAIAFFALIQTSYNYADDVRRSFTGERSWIGLSRYVSEFLSIFIHTNIKITDISPLTQFFSIVCIALTSYAGVYVISDGNVTIKSLIPASFFGLSPFYIPNLAYKFDCPYMTIAILAGVIPFLFIKDEKEYVFMSVISLITACISYQAGTSIYIVVTAIIAFNKWLENKPLKEIFRFVLISILCFIVSLVFFKLFFLNTKSDIQTANYFDMSSGAKIFPTMLRNIKEYLLGVYQYFGNYWIKFFFSLTLIFFIIVATKECKRNKIIGFFLSIFILIFNILFSYGAYLILAGSFVHVRAFMGFTSFIAITATFIVVKSHKPVHTTAFLCTVFLFYGFIVYDAVFGNVLAKQKAYENFRITVLLSDLNDIVVPDAKNTFYIQEMPGWGENSNIERENYNIPLVNLSPALSHYLLNDYNMYFTVYSEDYFEQLSAKEQQFLKSLPLIKDTYYHTICGENNMYYIYLKHPANK